MESLAEALLIAVPSAIIGVVIGWQAHAGIMEGRARRRDEDR